MVRGNHASVDLRKQTFSRERSINLALSHRGLEALKGVSKCLDISALLAQAVPMSGRMIHSLKRDEPQPQPYGIQGESLLSIDRRLLNEILLDATEPLENVYLHFTHELRTLDPSTGKCEFLNTKSGDLVTINAEFIAACDGAHSSIRSQLLKPARLRFNQFYIDHCYVELTVPSSEQLTKMTSFNPGKKSFGKWIMDPNHLHIWPRLDYMLIALPNPDGSFTCTLFAPWELVNGITESENLLTFFQTQFPDVLPYLPNLEAEFFGNPRGPLISVECSPHFYGRCVLLGDAAHAMVPFYGQGMNCGFEDVKTLFVHLRQLPKENLTLESLQLVLDGYSRERTPDTAAMGQLALQNYAEMRAHVVAPKYIVRRSIGRFLHRLLPYWFASQYHLVSFTSTRYSVCLSQGNWLNKVFDSIVATSALSAFVIACKLLKWNIFGSFRQGISKLLFQMHRYLESR
jgi:kynurenine 3-monooxygenase